MTPIATTTTPSLEQYGSPLHHTVLIDAIYLELIQKGIKTVEGRIYRNQYMDIKTGDTILFVDQSTPPLKGCCRVINFSIYDSFKSMLECEGLAKCLPLTTSIEQGEALYLSFPGYKEAAQNHPIVAFSLAYDDILTKSLL